MIWNRIAWAATIGSTILALAAFSWIWCDRAGLIQYGDAWLPSERRLAGDFTLQLLDGSSLDLRTVRKEGRAILLNFWAPWCPPCIREAPVLEALSRAQQDRVTVIGVDAETDVAQATAFVARHQLTYAIGYDPTGTMISDFRVRLVPVTYVITRRGSILRRYEGELTVDVARDIGAELENDSNGAN